MKNVLNYFYNIFPSNIYPKDKYVFFTYDNENYCFHIYNRSLEETKALYDLNVQMINNNLLVHEIILNKDNQAITYIDNIPYILFKVYVNVDKKCSLNDVIEINNSTYMIKYDDILNRSNWIKLWSEKVDYFELHINHFGKKYPVLASSLSYFIGLAENAIMYIKSTYLEINIPTSLVVCNKRINCNDTYFDIYNPLNYVVDSRVRDFSEYIKTSFFCNKNIWEEIEKYFYFNNLSFYEYRLLFGRLLYPSFYFDIYEDIINENRTEKEIINIIEKVDEYENFLIDMYYLINDIVKIPEVDWLINKKI
jgi:hypothetical protein